jgi:23S rRNA pseudouridine2605 synthase
VEERIQKILAKCGIASRRKAEEMISQGLVTVNGARATLGMKASFGKDHIKVNGKLISKSEPRVYIKFHKPNKCITSMKDPEGRLTVKDFLKGVKRSVFPVGRLDYDSEGLLLVTNDGDLAHAIMHPKGKIPKTYLVKIEGVLLEEDILKLQKGIKLKDGVTAPARVKKIKKTKANSWIEITIYEGRKRQIRRMLDKIGHSVIRLRRVKINGLNLGSLPSGKYCFLSPDELKRIKREVTTH